MMRTPMILLLAIGGLAMRTVGQTEDRIEAHVSTVTNGTVYLDKGRADGIEPGDTVILHVPGQAQVHVRIRVVSRSSSRADVPAGVTITTPGFRAEVLVPSGRGQTAAQQPETPAPVRASPQHLPWSNSETGFNQDEPLLAPAFGQGAAARPTRIFGRVFGNYTGTWDGGIDNRQFSLARLGTDVTVENPVHEGGRLRFRGDVTGRLAHLNDVPDVTSHRLRLDRLSYAWGDELGAPVRVEVGRFLPSLAPELGVLDGVEGVLAVNESSKFGASVGALPEPSPASASGDDIQTALSYRFTADGDDQWLETTVALQKTWHKGAPDRDLLFGDLMLRPTDDLTFYSSAWIDYYTAGDSIKSQGLQLTEFLLNGNYRINTDHGIGLLFSHIRWPELKRTEFRTLPPSFVRDNRLDRIGVNSWHEFIDGVRLDLRLDHFDDQDTSGTSGEVRVSLRDLLYEQGEVSVSLFRSEASFTQGSGFRLNANRYFGFGFGGLRYEISEFDNNGITGAETITEQALGADLSFNVTAKTNASINMDYRFGDAQNAFTLGLFVQTRF